MTSDLAGAPLELGEDVVAARDPEIDLVARREPELVDAVDVAGVGDRDAQPVVARDDRDRDDALQCPQRDELGGVGRDALFLEIDEREAVAAGERPCDAVDLRVALVPERLGERAGACPAARGREPVARDELASSR